MNIFRKRKSQEIDKEFQKAFNEMKKDPLIAIETDKIKSQFGDKFNQLREIVNRHDPEGLIEIGAPEDEYEPEVKTILVQLEKTENESEILDLVHCEFERWFGNVEKKENFINLAKEISAWKNNFKK